MPNYSLSETMFLEIQKDLKILKSFLIKKHLISEQDLFCDNDEFINIMKISKRTAQHWRDSNFIEFSQIGNKIYYKLADIQKLLNDNYNPKKI